VKSRIFAATFPSKRAFGIDAVGGKKQYLIVKVSGPKS